MSMESRYKSAFSYQIHQYKKKISVKTFLNQITLINWFLVPVKMRVFTMTWVW